MSLISLLIALAAERYLSSSSWQFNSFYKKYVKLFQRSNVGVSPWAKTAISLGFIVIPVLASYILLNLVDNSLLHLILSTVILIVCFGCVKTRDIYKQYLMAAFRGEKTTCELHHKQLLQDKNLPYMSFGHLLIWLNYRYFIAIMLFFVLFGAPGALCYRLLTRVTEQGTLEDLENIDQGSTEQDSLEQNGGEEISGEQYSLDKNSDDDLSQNTVKNNETSTDKNTVNVSVEDEVSDNINTFLFWLDWLPVRIVAFGYMMVGHFSKALPTWLENAVEINIPPHQILIAVAEKSEDVMMELDDCTAEPCLLVRLAKRTLLLCLAIISLLILTGVIS